MYMIIFLHLQHFNIVVKKKNSSSYCLESTNISTSYATFVGDKINKGSDMHIEKIQIKFFYIFEFECLDIENINLITNMKFVLAILLNWNKTLRHSDNM